MGLLRDLLERRHQDQRDQQFREFDTYKSILSDPRPLEQGGFSDEQKQDALQRIVDLSAPSKKHAQAMMPLLQGLTGIGGGIKHMMGGGGGEAQAQAQAPAPAQSAPSGAPGQSSPSPSQMMSPSILAGGAPSPDFNMVDQSGMTPGMMTPPAQSTPPPSPSPSPAVAPQPSATPTASNPPNTPSTPPTSQPGRGSIFTMPTLEQRQARARQVNQFNTGQEIDKMQQMAPAQIQIQGQQLDAQLKRYNELYQQNKTLNMPEEQATLMAQIGAGFKLPSGAFTAAGRAAANRSTPLNSNQVLPSSVPGEGAVTIDRSGHRTVLPGVQPHTPTQGVGEQSRVDQLGAYAQKLGKTVDQLTPQERVEAVAHATGPVQQLVRAKQIVADPNATPEEKSAAQMFLKGQELNQSKTQVTINTANAQNQPYEVKDNSSEYKVAQDLAYGKLTLQGFRTLYAYSRNAGVKTAIYEKASELNPGFNPAQFEMGFKLASNPKVQQQLAALDNVKQGIKPLLEASEAAARSGSPTLNRFIQKGGITVGNKVYSDLGAASLAFADELSGALGFGSATDMSRQMGINLTDPTLNPRQFQSVMQNVVEPFVSRKKQTMLDQMGVYGQPGMNPAAGPKPGQEQPQSQTQPQAQGESANGKTMGGYQYTERTDLPPQVQSAIKEGQQQSVTSPDGHTAIVKRHQGRFYEVKKSAGKGK